MSKIIISFGGESNIANQREHKGTSLLDVPDSYIALDLETTGLDPYFDSIIEIGAIRIRNGVEADSFDSLVNPEYDIDEFITDLTGITNEMLSSAPTLKSVLPHALDFIGEDIVVAHNANFDINFMYDACCSLSLPPFSNDFIDTMRMSRRLFPELPHHRLTDIVQHFGISDIVSHRACDDAKAAYMCFEYMKHYIHENKINPIVFSQRRKSTCHYVKASDITTNNRQFDESSPVFGKLFVFTGTLEKMVRKDAMQVVVDMGGKCGDSITKKTNYLVLGNNDYCSSIKDGKSNKQKRAEQLKLAGHDIEILSESAFYDMISAV